MAGSSVRFSDATGAFCQTEGATVNPAVKTFCHPLKDGYLDRPTTVNKFEGRSSYFSYYPTNELYEQRLETVWFHHKNKQLADKRRDEETAAYLREWA